MAAAESWQGMRERCAALLRTSTGDDVGTWNERVAATGIDDEPGLRHWLTAQGVTGYPQALLVWERFGYPDFMTADAGELIDGQYRDRPGLRPVLDAILGVLPEVGDVTVQARKTLISLVSPKRTFAVVQATTRTRVDLGIRLDDHQPGGRLLAAKNLGMANLRIGLGSPADLDDEAAGLLRLAYQESVAPPKPRKRAPRPTGSKVALRVIIEGFDLPGRVSCPEPGGTGYDNVHVALRSPGPGLTVPGCPWVAGEPIPGDAASARWELDINVLRSDADGGFDFTGRYVRGDKTDRNLGLAWGNVLDDGTFQLFRAAKLRLAEVPVDVLGDALSRSRPLRARVRLTDARGNPVCARVRPPAISWGVAP